MIRAINFHVFHGNTWPSQDDLKPHFFDPALTDWSRSDGQDNRGLRVLGVDGTDHLEPNGSRIDITLTMWGHSQLGVLLYYRKAGSSNNIHLFSKGNMGLIKQWTRTVEGDLRPIGLYIPFATAWLAVKEFMETDGQLPKSIEWVRAEDLPPNTFPDPWEHPEVK